MSKMKILGFTVVVGISILGLLIIYKKDRKSNTQNMTNLSLNYTAKMTRAQIQTLEMEILSKRGISPEEYISEINGPELNQYNSKHEWTIWLRQPSSSLPGTDYIISIDDETKEVRFRDDHVHIPYTKFPNMIGIISNYQELKQDKRSDEAFEPETPFYSTNNDTMHIDGYLGANGNAETIEYSEETLGAIVYGFDGNGFQIAVIGNNSIQKKWIFVQKSNCFRSIESFLIDNDRCYLTMNWRRVIYSKPSYTAPTIPLPLQDIRPSKSSIRGGEVSAKTISCSIIDNIKWCNVIAYFNPEADPISTKKIAIQGWVPLYNKSGQLQIWFYTRD